MKKYLTVILCALFPMMHSAAQSKYDLQRPFGWATSTSLTSGDDYNLTGGGAFNTDLPDSVPGRKTIVVRNTGGDMRDALISAIKANDIIILDGSDGELTVSGTLELKGLSSKTIIGRNNASIRTRFRLTPDIHKLLNDSNVLSLSTAAAKQPFILPNGQKVKEECEYAIRKILSTSLNDPKETYRHSGLMHFYACENIILRNITFQGPGSVDVSGDDLVTLSDGSRHIWVDHCEFVDGIDGNFDINGHSDFITISWCVFRYTPLSYVHANTNLVGSSDNEKSNGEDNLNVTYAFNRWGEGCDQRMPMVRFGTIHVMNNLYDCQGNHGAVNPRRNSEVLVENNYFDKGVRKIFSENGSRSFQLRGNIYSERFKQPADKGAVYIPYKYEAAPACLVPDIVRQYAGPRK